LDIETYLHRIGRTGRFGKKGKAINFVHDVVTWNQINEIETALGTNIQKIASTPPEGVSLGEYIDEQLNKKSKPAK
jgi:ATP-dependent RNA helicase DDX19/DBP5